MAQRSGWPPRSAMTPRSSSITRPEMPGSRSRRRTCEGRRLRRDGRIVGPAWAGCGAPLNPRPDERQLEVGYLLAGRKSCFLGLIGSMAAVSMWQRQILRAAPFPRMAGIPAGCGSWPPMTGGCNGCGSVRRGRQRRAAFASCFCNAAPKAGTAWNLTGSNGRPFCCGSRLLQGQDREIARPFKMGQAVFDSRQLHKETKLRARRTLPRPCLGR